MNRNHGLMRITLASPALAPAAPQKNLTQHIGLIEQAAAKGSSVILFPELSLCGAGLGEAFRQEQVLRASEEALISLLGISKMYPELLIAAGAPLRHGSKLYNGLVLMLGGHFLGAGCKQSLGGQGLTDGRFFDRPPQTGGESLYLGGHSIPLNPGTYRLNWGSEEINLAVLIHEDLDQGDYFAAASQNAELILCPSAQARTVTSLRKRELSLEQKSRESHSAILYANASFGESGQDEVFGGELYLYEDGHKVASAGSLFAPQAQTAESWIDIAHLRYRRRGEIRGPGFSLPLPELNLTGPAYGKLCARLPEQGLRPLSPSPFIPEDPAEQAARCEEILSIQAAGLARRLRQIHCSQIVLGVSGGLDSTLALLASVRALELLGLKAENLLAVTLPGFGTSDETYQNAARLMDELEVEKKEISIIPASLQHFKDIGHDPAVHDVSYENTQARERTQILMDLANKRGGILVGTGDLSELALGWCTYNGDHMSMYAVNASVPKTLIRPLLAYEGRRYAAKGHQGLASVLEKISATAVSPELLPPDAAGQIAQKTEEIVGPYALHDFFLYHMLRSGASPEKIMWLAEQAFGENSGAEEKFTPPQIRQWLRFFLKRFFTQQFKRNCAPDGAAVGSLSFSPRQGFRIPSDADMSLWLDNL